MRSSRLVLSLATLIALAAVTAPAAAQGQSKKHYEVSSDRAVIVTKEVLVRQGFEIIGVEEEGPVLTIYYRRGNMGRGKGKGRPEKLLIRRVDDQIVFENTPSGVLVDIDIRLKL